MIIFFCPYCELSLWKAASVRSDSVFIECSNPGSPCCQVHCLSLCSLPIWLSTALQVAKTTSPHCSQDNNFWPDRSFAEPQRWTTLNELTTKSVEDCNDIHNLYVSPAAATDHVFPLGISVLMCFDSGRNSLFVDDPTSRWNINCATAITSNILDFIKGEINHFLHNCDESIRLFPWQQLTDIQGLQLIRGMLSPSECNQL